MKLRIKIDGQTYEAEVEIVETDESESDDAAYAPVSVGYQASPSEIAVADVQTPENVERETLCRSPVTGLVITVNVRPGQMVQPNEVILVLESMKMETQVTARHAAIVKRVLVGPGNPVKVNQTLVEFEEQGGSASVDQ